MGEMVSGEMVRLGGGAPMKPEAALHAINEILSPPPRMEQGLRVYVDAYGDLAGALMDLERLGADPVCIRTIRRVLRQLEEVSNVLQRAGYK
jgi:type VI protein secretion system component VasF